MRFFLVLSWISLSPCLSAQPDWVTKQQARMEEANAFEAALSGEEIAYVTQDNPGSLFRVMKRAFVLSSPKCTEADYRILKEKMGASELAARGPGVMALASAYEKKFVSKYMERILKMLATSQKYAKQKALLSSFYSEGLKELQSVGFNEDSAKRITSYEKELAQTGLAATEVRRYVLEKASLSPECLGGINIPFIKIHHVDVTMERGRSLLGTLKDYVKKTGERPENSGRLPIQAGRGVFGETKDSWGNWYRITYSGNHASIYSDGGKGNENILIGTIELEK